MIYEQKKRLESIKYVERCHKVVSGGITVRCMVKANLEHPDERPILFMAEKNELDAFAFNENDACNAVIKKSRNKERALVASPGLFFE